MAEAQANIEVAAAEFVTDGMAMLDKPGVGRLVPISGLARFVFRGEETAEKTAGKAFGLAFPAINRAATSGERAKPGARAVLRLGPDECLLIAPEAEGDALFAAIEGALKGVPHSLVEVSDRNQGLLLDGPEAAALINSGCPLDLSLAAFPVGMATRTLFHKAEIVVWRVGESALRIEVWRSFTPYVTGLLAEAAKDHF